VKMECTQHIRPALSERQKLRSDIPRVFTEISPLSTKDVQSVIERRSKGTSGSKTDVRGQSSTTPTQKKRKLDTFTEKENVPSDVN